MHCARADPKVEKSRGAEHRFTQCRKTLQRVGDIGHSPRLLFHQGWVRRPPFDATPIHVYFGLIGRSVFPLRFSIEFRQKGKRIAAHLPFLATEC